MYKISNAERRLRASESPNIEPDIGENGAIKGYKWIGDPIKSHERKVKDFEGNVEKVLKVAQTKLF